MKEAFRRTEWLLGADAMRRLAAARVAVFGIGGVGGYVVEALTRSGVGNLILVDHDQVDVTNLNRQIIATEETLGRDKVEVAAERIARIDPDCRVETRKEFFLPENRDAFDFASFDYVVDAIDTVAGKLALIECAKAAGTPIISSMGTGNKLDPSALQVAESYDTSVCPLARVIRRECRARGIESLKVVYSQEEPRKPVRDEVADQAKGGQVEAGQAENGQAARREKPAPGSTAFVPPAAGLIIASEVVKDLAGGDKSFREEEEA